MTFKDQLYAEYVKQLNQPAVKDSEEFQKYNKIVCDFCEFVNTTISGANATIIADSLCVRANRYGLEVRFMDTNVISAQIEAHRPRVGHCYEYEFDNADSLAKLLISEVKYIIDSVRDRNIKG